MDNSLKIIISEGLENLILILVVFRNCLDLLLVKEGKEVLILP